MVVMIMALIETMMMMMVGKFGKSGEPSLGSSGFGWFS